MDFITFELTPNGKAIRLKSNALANLPEIDFIEVTIQLCNIAYIVVEEQSSSGLNITLTCGTKYVLLPGTVTMVGAIDYKLTPTYVCPDNTTLWQNLLTLLAW